MDNKSETNPFELLEMVRTSRKSLVGFIWLQSLVMVCLVIGVVIVSKKPPMVIRIDKLGNADSVYNYTIDSVLPSDDDVRFFAKKFIDEYVGLKSNLVIRQFEASLNMMTEDLAKHHLNTMKEQNTVAVIQAAGVRNDFVTKDISIEKMADEFFVKVTGILETRKIDDLNSTPQRKNLDIALLFVAVQRSAENPYGLLAKNIHVAQNQEEISIKDSLGAVINE